MTKQRLYSMIYATLTSLKDGGGPESHIMVALQAAEPIDLDWFHSFMQMLTKAGWITIKSHWVELTPAGLEFANQIDEAAKLPV